MAIMKKCLLLVLTMMLLLACLPALAEKEATIQISVNGLNDPIKSKIVTMMANRVKDIPRPLNAEKVQLFYKQAPGLAIRGLQPYGYFKSHVTARLEKAGNDWAIVLDINPGPIVKVTNVDLKITGEGANDPAFKHLSRNLEVKTGQTLDIDNYQKAKDSLFNLAANRGYFKAKMLENKIVLNVEALNASIILHFETGPRFVFGETLFPPSDLNRDLLEDYLRYKPGEYFSNAQIQKTQQALAGSGFFSQTVVTPLPTQAEHVKVPIKVELTPVKPQRYTLGLGYGTDTGPRGTLGFSWKPINSYGHSLNILARGSYLAKTKTQTRQNSFINASYVIPGPDPATDAFTISSGYGYIVQDTGKASSFKSAFSYNTVLGDDWQEILALTYLQENYQLTNTPYINATVLFPSGHWQYIRNRAIQKDKIVNNGVSATFDVAGASQALLSHTNFAQGKAGLKALGTLEATHTRFLFRSQLGYTGVNQLDSIPLTLQLFAGGPGSIRGFAYNVLGPGRNLVITSGEIQQRVYDNWYLAGFIDSGVISGSDPTVRNNGGGHYMAGAGGGIVYLTPIGGVEIAVARPVIAHGDFKTWQLEFSVGTEL